MIYQRKKSLSDLLFLFFGLFVFGSTFSIALAQIALGVSLVLFIILCIASRCNPLSGELRWFYIFAGLYIFWMLLASLLGDTPVESILILKEEWLFCVVPIGIYLLARENYRRRLIYLFTIGCGLFAAYGLVQFFTGVHWFKSVAPNAGPEFGYVIKGNFPSPMTFGNYFGTAAGFLAGYTLSRWRTLDKRGRSFFGIVVLLTLVATLGSYNRGAFLGLVVAFMVLSIILRNRKMILTVGSVILLAVITMASVSDFRQRISWHIEKELAADYEGGRIFIWTNSLKIVGENPVFGVGQGNFRYAYAEYLPDDVDGIRKHVHAHNDFINIAAIAGIPGLGFFAGIWVAVLGYMHRRFRSLDTGEAPPADEAAPAESFAGAPILLGALAGSMVFLISSLTEATFADEEVRQMLMFIWAVGLFQLIPSTQKPG